MADWSTPTLGDLKVDVLTLLKARDSDAASLAESPTNPPTGYVRYNRTTDQFQEWDGLAWVDLVLSISGGGTGSTSALNARTALGLGTLATQNSNAIAVSGGTISGLATLGVLGNVTISGLIITGSGPVTLTNSNGNILETAIADGTLLARNAGNESITGNWTFANNLTVNNVISLVGVSPQTFRITATNSGVNEKVWDTVVASNSFYIATISDAGVWGTTLLQASRSGTTIGTVTLGGNWNFTNPILAPNGASGTVAYGFTGDPDTGMYRPNPDQLVVQVGGYGMTLTHVGGNDFTVSMGVGGKFATSLIPNVDDTWSLGRSGNRWEEVWAANGVIQTSDIRHKHVINTIDAEEALDAICALDTFTAQFKHAKHKDDVFPALSAQDVKSVLDNQFGTRIVVVDQYDIHSMYYDRLIPILCASIRGLRAEVQRLRSN